MLSEFKIQNHIMDDVYKICPFYALDGRGGLIKCFSYKLYRESGIKFDVAETLIIKSKKNVLRGLHFQREKPVAKLITCIYGLLYAVVLDVRKDSAGFGNWAALEVTENEQVYIPGGYALGTYALKDSCMICMNNEKMYSKYDSGIKWDDKTLSIEWPFNILKSEPVVSEKDRNLMTFEEYVNQSLHCKVK